MRKRYLILFIIVLVTTVQCAVDKKISYSIPSYFKGERKTEFLENLEKGKVLFKQHCSSCHGIFSKGKEGVPNFTNQEIKNYLTAYQTNDQRNHAVIKKLLPEEMSMILTFLQYRKIDSLPQHTH